LIKKRNHLLILIVLTGLLSIALPILTSPSSQAGLFDCRNLKNRTEVNQRNYERSLNRYQNSLANWVNSGAKYQGSFVVQNRFKETGQRILVMLNDFIKHEKCLKLSKESVFIQIASVKKSLVESNYAVLQYLNPLGEYTDFRTLLK
jgi:hypothetical protein